jgi:hypothetical protein
MDPSRYPGGRYWYIDIINESLVELARASARRAQQAAKKRQRLRVRRWQALRPGVDTPLWNALAGAVRAQLKRRGEKSRLARLLGLSRQRLHLLIVAQTAYPDAERALLLQVWLQTRLLSRELALRQPRATAVTNVVL